MSQFVEVNGRGSRGRRRGAYGPARAGHNSGNRSYNGTGQENKGNRRSSQQERTRGSRGGHRRPNRDISPWQQESAGASRSPRKKEKFYPMFKRWSESDNPGTVVFQMCLSKELLEKFLTQDVVAEEEITLLLNALGLAMTSQHQKESIKEVLELFCKSRFLEKKVINSFLTKKSISKASWEDAKDVFQILITVIEEILDKLPKYANQCVYISSRLSSMISSFTNIQSDTELETTLKDLKAKSYNIDKAERSKEIAKMESHFFYTEGSKEPPDNFKDLPIVPTYDDLKKDSKPFLRRAVVKGVYEDATHYLDVQFRLMKQDFVLPLRLGINEFIDSGFKKDLWSSDIRIYNNVHIKEMIYKGSIDHVLQFDVSRLKNVKWDVSKRLIFGSLLCMSKDNFQSVIFATVADRDVRKLVNGIITVTVKTGFDIVFSSSISDTFVMLETTAYFESYQHVLKGLQEMSSHLPLQDYIIRCERKIKPPKYLLFDGEVPMYRLDCLMALRFPINVPILTTVKWPPTQEMCLNESQREAAQMALTKEMALIQGPPGTGKTYVGLKVMQALLENKSVRQKGDLMTKSDPILIVCYTNHALDQFLEGVLKFCPSGIIRVGGKSSSKLLEEFNLKNVKQKFRKEKVNDRSVRAMKAICMDGLNSFTRKIFETSAKINKLDVDIVDEAFLEPYISQHHYNSLCQSHHHYASHKSCMRQWLNVSDQSAEKAVPIIIRNHLTKLVLRWRTDQSSDLTENMNICQRASFYMHLLTQYRQVLYNEMMYLSQFSSDYFIQGKMKNLEDLFHLSFTSILPDQLLQWVLCMHYPIDRFLSYLSSEVLKTQASEYNDRLIECWLLGLHNGLQTNLDDAQILSSGLSGVVLDEFDDVEASKEAQDSRIIDDGDDDDDEDIVGAAKLLSKMQYEKNSLASVMQRMDMLGITEEVADLNQEQPAAQWTRVNHSKKLSSCKIRHKLISVQPMSEEEVSQVTDVWALEPKRRFSFYKYWIQKYQKVLKMEMQDFVMQYTTLYERKRELNNEETLTLLKMAEVIGMTTTGAAKHRAVLQALGCRIIVVEEAAEVLEAHIVTALNKNCNHLILIGDHQQLRPNPTVYELAKDYGLEISLFERLINNQVPHIVLKEQHRMRPEISKIMRHIYEDLEDHFSVRAYENINGVSKNIFFINHSAMESKVEDTKSKANKHEANYVTALCTYLILQGYEPSQITILATYTGQVFAIKKIMNETKLGYPVRVTAVDNYQGEENDIIILSLVRSNLDKQVGFLKVDNRVCVALSRAKKGLFVIGNFDLLATQSTLWKKIVTTAEEENIIGNGLPVCCTNHPEFQEVIVNAEDFNKCPDGGCGQPCNFRLICGHVCPRTCHAKDREHKDFKCTKQCTKTCTKGHMCKKKCYQECGDCVELVLKTISICKHEDKVYCSVSVDEAICKQTCLGLLSCGHSCPGKCGQCRISQRHLDCTEPVPFTWPCGHQSVIECSQKNSGKPCPWKCGAILDCGHTCKGKCSDCLEGLVHVACEEKCEKQLICGHKCHGHCGDQCLPCTLKCPDRCSHSYCSKGKSVKRCGEACTPCTQPCAYSCTHSKCLKTCSEFCGSISCNKRCNKKVHKCFDKKNCKSKLHACTHTCSGLCGERCVCAVCETVSSPTATDGRVKADDIESQLNEMKLDGKESDKVNNRHDVKQSDTPLMKLNCGHIFKVDKLDKYLDTFDPDGCQYLQCPLCKQLITESMRYERAIKERRAKRETAKEALKKETTVAKEEKEKLILSEKEFDDSPFFTGIRVKNIEGSIKRLELEALSFQFKCAYALNIANLFGATDSEQWEREVQSMKTYLLKINKRVTAQQKKEFSKASLKLVTLACLRQLEMLGQLPEKMLSVRELLNGRTVDREGILNFYDSIATSSDGLIIEVSQRGVDVTEYWNAKHKIAIAMKVLLSNDKQMLCDVLNPQPYESSLNETTLNQTQEPVVDDQDERSEPNERFANKLSHQPLTQISVPSTKRAHLPSLADWGKKFQTTPGSHMNKPEGGAFALPTKKTKKDNL